MRFLPSVATLAVAAIVPAQPTLISPLAAAAGPSGDASGLFVSGPIAHQQVHNGASFTSQSPTALTRMQFRAAKGWVGYAAPTLDVELFLARSPNDAANANQVFASNVVPASEVNVFVRKPISLPVVSTNDWLITFAFDSLFIWLPVDTSWRAVIWSSTGGVPGYFVDHWREPPGNAGPIGTGCTPANANFPWPASLNMVAPWLGGPGTAVRLQGMAGYTNARPTVLNIGASRTSWGAITLPYSLAALGAPSCFVTNDAVATMPGTSSGSGVPLYNFSLAIPYLPGLGGQSFYTQMLVLDAGANSLGLVTSNTCAFTVLKPTQATTIVALGGPSQPSGLAEGGRCVAVMLN